MGWGPDRSGACARELLGSMAKAAGMKDGDILTPELMARRQDWQEGISIYMRQRTVGSGAQVVAPIQWVKHNPADIVEPMLRIGIQEAQQLMDELWQCGLRASTILIASR